MQQSGLVGRDFRGTAFHCVCIATSAAPSAAPKFELEFVVRGLIKADGGACLRKNCSHSGPQGAVRRPVDQMNFE
jgi:hypothetical protein